MSRACVLPRDRVHPLSMYTPHVCTHERDCKRIISTGAFLLMIRTHTYTHTFTHAYTLARIHTHLHTFMHACLQTCMHECMHAYRQTDRQTDRLKMYRSALANDTPESPHLIGQSIRQCLQAVLEGEDPVRPTLREQACVRWLICVHACRQACKLAL